MSNGTQEGLILISFVVAVGVFVVVMLLFFLHVLGCQKMDRADEAMGREKTRRTLGLVLLAGLVVALGYFRQIDWEVRDKMDRDE